MRREGFSEWELWARCPRTSLHSASGCVARQVEAGRSRRQAFCMPPGRGLHRRLCWSQGFEEERDLVFQF